MPARQGTWLDTTIRRSLAGSISGILGMRRRRRGRWFKREGGGNGCLANVICEPPR